jgi:hypothetical protein
LPQQSAGGNEPPAVFFSCKPGPKEGLISMTYIYPRLNGNGRSPVNGRGLKHRKSLNGDLVRLTADIATGERPFLPSIAQSCQLTGASRKAVADELKRRTATMVDEFTRLAESMTDRELAFAFTRIGYFRVRSVLRGEHHGRDDDHNNDESASGVAASSSPTLRALLEEAGRI